MNKTYGIGVRCGALGLSFAVILAATLGLDAQPKSAAKEKPAAVEALIVSDIHFDPFWDPSKVDRLRSAPVSEWKGILAAPEAADRAERFTQLEQTCKLRVSPDTSYESVRFEPSSDQRPCRQSEIRSPQWRPYGARV